MPYVYRYVTGVCSTRNLAMVRSLGADRVVDYSQEDFTRSGVGYDVILDAIGNHSFAALRRVLNPKGVCLMVGAPSGRWIKPIPSAMATLFRSAFVSQTFVGYLSKASHDDLALVSDLMVKKKVTSIIDRYYSLTEVPQAIAYLEQGHARGKVVIDVRDARAAD
jgi:NADPH:quinone reductase-like Zn-dependent oxidoreductase